MSNPSESQPDRSAIRTKIMGLGERAGSKSYYPQLQMRIRELEENRAHLEEKSAALAQMLEELHLACRKAEESETKFRLLFECLADGVLVAETHARRIIMGNDAVCRMLGYAREELPGLGLVDVYLSHELPGILESMQNSDSDDPGEAPLEFPVKRKDGSILWAEISSTRLELDGRECVMGVLRDITERKRAEDELRRSEQKFRELAELLPQTVFETDLTGRITFANRIALDMFGYSFEDIEGGLDCLDMLVPEDREQARRDLARALLGEDLPGRQYMALRKDGRSFPCIVYTTVSRDDAGIIGVRGIVVDITEHTRLREQKDLIEAQYHQAQKMEAIGRLAGGIAHDLNNLLCPILGYGEMLLSKDSSGTSAEEPIMAIVSAGLKARDLVQQLLAFSRRQTLAVRVVDLNRVIADFERLLRRMIREDIEIQLRLYPNLPKTRADAGQIEQVIMNLAVNAQDAMPGGGRLTIETGVAILDASAAAAHHDMQSGTYVLLAVTDTGEGMDAGTQAHIFDPFFTTKEKGKGTGLGLATVYGIVKQHGGGILVHSETNRGSTFKIYLPAAAADTLGADASAQSSTDRCGTETILLAEDNEMVRELAVSILTRLGYVVHAASSGEECLRVLGDLEGSFDLLITDVIMPDMNGKTLFETIATRYPGAKVLYMSGYTDDVIVHHGVLDEGIAFLQKPFTIESLAAKVREVLEG